MSVLDWFRTAGRLRELEARLEAAARVAADERAGHEAALREAAGRAAAREAELAARVTALEETAARQAAALDASHARLEETLAEARPSAAERAALVRAMRAHPPFPNLPRAGAFDPEPWFYAAFEAMFRGTREEIAGRLAVHLDEAVTASRDCGGFPLIDVGCGRGEWLDLAGSRGLRAIGVDVNADMVAECRARGLDAHAVDAISHLQRVGSGAVGVVTAFHVVEHLPINTLVALLVEVERVLAPGGLLILETPNPDNLVVGANTFWLDPSHLRPLPPRLLRFCVESSGLVVDRVQPMGPDPDVMDEAAAQHWPAGLAQALGGPRDYAIIARKARP